MKRRLAICAALMLASPMVADGRCGGVNGHCGYKYYVPTDAERIASLQRELQIATERKRDLEGWLIVVGFLAALSTIGCASLGWWVYLDRKQS